MIYWVCCPSKLPQRYPGRKLNCFDVCSARTAYPLSASAPASYGRASQGKQACSEQQQGSRFRNGSIAFQGVVPRDGKIACRAAIGSAYELHIRAAAGGKKIRECAGIEIR